MISVLFYGTSDFAVPILEALVTDPRFHVVGVVTQPDRPSGRHKRLTESPIKLAAKKFQLPVFQFEYVKSDEAFEQLRSIKADVAVVASFGQIIPQRVLDLTPSGALNVHGSILPNYRGASPIAAAIKHGDAITGFTYMKMDALMDHGPILSGEKIVIEPQDTTESLSKKMAAASAVGIADALIHFVNQDSKLIDQDHAQATRCKLLSREDGLLNPTVSTAAELERTIRAYDPWPGTYLMIEGQRLKILTSQVAKGKTSLAPGTRTISENLPGIVCSDGQILLLINLQVEGKKPLDGATFLRGKKGWAQT